MKFFRFFFSSSVRLLAISAITLSLSSCLVNEDDVPSIKNRTTNNFRILTGGEYYEYRVYGQITSNMGVTQSFEGTLRVEYFSDTIRLPFSLTSVAALREETTLNLGGSVYNLTRFLQQDTTPGSLTEGKLDVMAVRVGSAATGTLYRTGENTQLNNPHPIEILKSPVPDENEPDAINISYQYMSNCESPNTSCTAAVQEINNILIRYQGNADVTTFNGRYNTLRIDYDGQFLGPFSPSTPALFDIRGACDDDTAMFFGSTYVFPEVGVVFLENSCTAADSAGHHYTASLSSTNVPIP